MIPFWNNYRQKKELKRFCGEVESLRHNDDDLMDAETKEALDQLIADTHDAMQKPQDNAFLAAARQRLQQIVPPRRFRTLREWLDIIAVVGTVAFGFRGLFFQPFKIPTSSMQPTLYGIHFMNREGNANSLLDKVPAPVGTLLFSTRPASLTIAGQGGVLDPESVRISGNALFDSLTFRIGKEEYRLPGDPRKVAEYSGIGEFGRIFQPGERVTDGFLSLGDHLFVDRLSVNLTGLKRGDVVVFNTENIVAGDGTPLMKISGFYYIKRLAGLPGDTLRITDGQLWVRPAGESEFRKIQEIAPAFAKVYSGKGGYQGHTNTPGEGNSVAEGGYGYYLNHPQAEFVVPQDHYFMLGDNTKFSSDSRIWGTVPRRNIVGKACVVFWPFSRRWGLIDRNDPVDVPTGDAVRGTFPSMYLQ